ncbi:MAG: hypothetical protein P1V35_00940 [Planctomycetota bacterium]|nr:hypothetical protein [Sulfitobacter sp.]MDF1836408.1 hypothetical protein [Planctomycetota bacterium]
MQLPLIYLLETGDEAVLSVDGGFDGPGLQLSHWPGNETPEELKHELSTGIALNFVRLPQARQAELTVGLTALVNNHYDTDGVLALFVLQHPDVALAHADQLLEIAAAGDFFHVPTESAFCFDVLITLYGDRERSPMAEQLVGLADLERYRVVTEALFSKLPLWLEHGIDGEKALFSPALERLRTDLQGLQRAEIVPLIHFDLTAVHAAPGTEDEPGRHALFHTAGTDRVLWLAKDPHGVRARFVIGTRSWFDIPGWVVQPRPDLEALANRLNQLEGCCAEEASAWRFQSIETASPELWFGAPDLPLFCSFPGIALHPSQLKTELIRAEVCEAVRKVWTFVNEHETTDTEDIYAV